MDNIFILLWIVAVAWHVGAGDPPQEDLHPNWENYKRTFNKKYSSGEEENRRLIWEQNLEIITKHNSEYKMGKHTYTLGINKYSDMTTEEYSRNLTGLRIPSKIFYANQSPKFVFPPAWPIVDWRRYGAVTRVKDQSNVCGSCWAFSATGTLEGWHMRKTGQLVSLSEQNLVDCATKFGNHGCNGGFPALALEYVAENGGIDTEISYPYENATRICRFNNKTIGAKIAGFNVLFPQGNETILQLAVSAIGPISAAIFANLPTFKLYKYGIYRNPECNGTLDHTVLVVGYGSKNGEDYWIVKNSWGTSWGNQGYMLLARNKGNLCGIATTLTFPTG